MPTGYTAKVLDGGITTLKGYAKECGKAFGIGGERALDEVLDTSFHDEAILEATKCLEDVALLTEEQYEVKALNKYNDEVTDFYKRRDKMEENKARYKQMEALVGNWETSENIFNVKKFMMSQLHDSMEFDIHEVVVPVRLTGKQLREKEIKSAQWSLDYHSEELVEMKERQKESEEFLAFWNKEMDKL